MTDLGTWHKSSYSGGGDGNACVEIAHGPTRISVRGSRTTPASATLIFRTAVFAPFLDALKSRGLKMS
ncbi:DUF397 domain-containing protein [Streptomyces sp. NPDC090080]|jgi:hypothetical protein|uniref:DUF397 domain-containing protein n=1 Tax=Streptomyces sp. NPDC090080 TaxID=3365939 RepID=UPI003828B840